MEKKSFWQFPWGYGESFMVAMEIVLLGFILEVATPGMHVKAPAWPTNLVFGIIYLGILVLLYVKYRQSNIIKWLSSIPAAISSIVVVAFFAVLLGFLPQEGLKDHKFLTLIGLSDIKNSWFFILPQFYLLTSLGLVSIKRLNPLTVRNFGFFLSHGGLWIILFGAFLGSGDLKRLNLKVFENGEYKNMAMDKQMNLYNLPFKVKLLDFNIEEYNPKIALVDPNTFKLVEGFEKNLSLISDIDSLVFKGWLIKIDTSFTDAKWTPSGYQEMKYVGAAPAVKIIAKKLNNGEIREGWLSPGSFNTQGSYVQLESNLGLALTIPDPKVYSSLVDFVDSEGVHDTITIIVNKPFKYKRWKIYQQGYDSSKGKYSETSILEAVNDPWLPIIYTGIFALLFGSIYLYWLGKKD